jgi:hypothetical protein
LREIISNGEAKEVEFVRTLTNDIDPLDKTASNFILGSSLTYNSGTVLYPEPPFITLIEDIVLIFFIPQMVGTESLGDHVGSVG